MPQFSKQFLVVSQGHVDEMADLDPAIAQVQAALQDGVPASEITLYERVGFHIAVAMGEEAFEPKEATPVLLSNPNKPTRRKPLDRKFAKAQTNGNGRAATTRRASRKGTAKRGRSDIRSAVQDALKELGGKANLAAIANEIESTGSGHANRRSLYNSISQTVRNHKDAFKKVGKGQYALKA